MGPRIITGASLSWQVLPELENAITYPYSSCCSKLCCVTAAQKEESDLTLQWSIERLSVPHRWAEALHIIPAEHLAQVKHLSSLWSIFRISVYLFLSFLISQFLQGSTPWLPGCPALTAHSWRKKQGCLHLLGPTESLGVELVTCPLSPTRSSLS